MTDEMFRDQPISLLGRRTLIKKFKNKERRLSKNRDMAMDVSTPKKPRTSEDFYLFCKFILEYENYNASEKEESEDSMRNHEEESNENPEDSSKSSSSEGPPNSVVEMSSDDDSYDLITCFCGKPFAGRPMIECSKCLTWLHLRCAKVKKSDIPDVFICSHCQNDDSQ